MKNNITELVFILDNSGSMYGLEADTVGGFNSLIEKQKKIDGECIVSLVEFNSIQNVIYDRVQLNEIKQMKTSDFEVNGCTALYDAVGNAIKYIKKIHKHIRTEDRPNKTMFVITTDGYENASNKFSQSDVKKLIEEQKENSNWEFIFLGANIDSETFAKDIGINEDRALNYEATGDGTKMIFDKIERTVGSIRKEGCIKADWRENK